MKDQYGTEIKVGLRVAFNRSGDVRIGTVVKIAPNRGRGDYTFYVQDCGYNAISKVKTPHSLVVVWYWSEEAPLVA